MPDEQHTRRPDTIHIAQLSAQKGTFARIVASTLERPVHPENGYPQVSSLRVDRLKDWDVFADTAHACPASIDYVALSGGTVR